MRASLVIFLLLFGAGNSLAAGAACVMAKWQGNTLDYALSIVDGHVSFAQDSAKAKLREKGYARYNGHLDIRHPQSVSALPRAYVVVVKTTYRNTRNRERTSYGCGFAATSVRDALWSALRDLQAHSWGWVPDQHGYEIVEQHRY